MKNFFSLKKGTKGVSCSRIGGDGIRASYCVVSLAMILFLFTFVGCKQPTTPSTDSITVPDELYGTWKATDSWGTEWYKITNSTFTNRYGSKDCKIIEEASLSYEGNNLIVVPVSNKAGIIYLQYTTALDSSYQPTTDPLLAPIGKWYAVAYRELTANTIEISACSDGTGKSTLEEAKETYSYGSSYFFGWASECTKQ